MNPVMQKFVDQNFLTKAQAQYILEAIDRKENVIVAGHRSAGIRPFMANLMMIAMKSGAKATQVKKGVEDFKDGVDYLLIPGIDGIDFEELVYQAILKEGVAIITIKEPEHPLSLYKLMKKAFKETGDSSKVYHIIECNKENDIPFVTKITRAHSDDKGKTIRQEQSF